MQGLEKFQQEGCGSMWHDRKWTDARELQEVELAKYDIGLDQEQKGRKGEGEEEELSSFRLVLISGLEIGCGAQEEQRLEGGGFEVPVRQPSGAFYQAVEYVDSEQRSGN